jgi:hypothetical protein
MGDIKTRNSVSQSVFCHNKTTQKMPENVMQASYAPMIHVNEFNFNFVKDVYQDMANGTNRFIQKVEDKAKRGRDAAKKKTSDQQRYSKLDQQFN